MKKVLVLANDPMVVKQLKEALTDLNFQPVEIAEVASDFQIQHASNYQTLVERNINYLTANYNLPVCFGFLTYELGGKAKWPGPELDLAMSDYSEDHLRAVVENLASGTRKSADRVFVVGFGSKNVRPRSIIVRNNGFLSRSYVGTGNAFERLFVITGQRMPLSMQPAEVIAKANPLRQIILDHTSVLQKL